MPTPFFPNELVTHIFESLYTSLRSNPLFYTISINSIFAPFTLVDKRWRSLSLPYLVRHYDRPSTSIQGFLGLVNKYDLMKEVKSIHFAFEIPTPKSFMERQPDLIEKRYGAKIRRYEARDQYEKVEEKMEGWADETAPDAQLHVVRERSKKVEQERHLWDSLVLTCMPFVREVEVGKRSKDENFDDNLRIADWSELLNEGEYAGGPGEDVTHFLRGLKGPNVDKLRINLLSGISIAEIPLSTPLNFPLLQDLTIHRYPSHSDRFRQSPQDPRVPIWENLRRLSLINVCSKPKTFPLHITNSYLRPSATTLTHLLIKISDSPRYLASNCPQFHEADMFNDLVFPSVQEVNLKLRNLPHAEGEAVKQHFPNAQHYSLEVERDETF